jgi:hypothetical protein
MWVEGKVDRWVYGLVEMMAALSVEKSADVMVPLTACLRVSPMVDSTVLLMVARMESMLAASKVDPTGDSKACLKADLMDLMLVG